MTVDEIKKAVDEGKTVHCHSTAYVVIKDNIGQYLIKYLNAECVYIGLTHQDGVTLNGTEEEFYVP